MEHGTDVHPADGQISADEPQMAGRLGGLAWAGVFAIAVVAFVLVANF
jgi:hypothetical protein